MPSKIQLDENLWFLYICLQKSDMKAIDFNAVALATSLKAPAARMRFTRLKRQIESGTLIGTHGRPFSEPTFSKTQNRSKPSTKKTHGEDAETEGSKLIKGDVKASVERIKSEDRADLSGEDGYAISWEEEDSEDEMPLAKLRERRMMASSPMSVSQLQLPRQNRNLVPPAQNYMGMETPRFLPSLDMMAGQMNQYGNYGNQGPLSGPWVGYGEAMRAQERARNWHLEHVEER